MALEGPATVRALRGPRSSRGPPDVEWEDDRLMEFSSFGAPRSSSPLPRREDLDWSRGPSSQRPLRSTFPPAPTSHLVQEEVETRY